ncbi:hypothetical protein LR48_Vigan08g043000 [Vigna angularis]|uniref:Uncharacterized protein n=2 Tax=Phaseolus angularis TaxID=3914 RepID=A0A0L9V3I2_PHAAN|nr:hypothetical protein LR48_Vigan08g043000 [Vigna angularis]BAT89587.1 hypothetical protein VIGAN_06057500 [Vigna angularis var. angularis]
MGKGERKNGEPLTLHVFDRTLHLALFTNCRLHPPIIFFLFVDSSLRSRASGSSLSFWVKQHKLLSSSLVRERILEGFLVWSLVPCSARAPFNYNNHETMKHYISLNFKVQNGNVLR